MLIENKSIIQEKDLGWRYYMSGDEKIESIIRTLKKYGAKKIEVFGSYARGESKEDSDLDIIVEFSDKKSLLELVRIEQELEDNIGMKVDLLTKKFISPYLIEKIEKEARVVLE